MTKHESQNRRSLSILLVYMRNLLKKLPRLLVIKESNIKTVIDWTHKLNLDNNIMIF